MQKKTKYQMNYKYYFKEFSFKNESTKNKNIPYITHHKDYEYIVRYKYTIKDLQAILKRFELPRCKSTKKDDIKHFTTNMLYLSSIVCKIQKQWRNHFIRKFNETLGPSFRNSKQSNNIDDFLTTENIEDINYYYYFSFKDDDGFIYTFHLVSIVSLLDKNIRKNPYNRNSFDESIIQLVRKRIKYNKILNQTKEFQDYEVKPTTIHDRILQLFHKMDQLGNYTNSLWFSQLSPRNIRIFIYELYEIWNYRAQLTTEIKETICPPNGNPFRILPRNFIANMNDSRQHYSNHFLRSSAVNIMEKFIYSAHDDTNKNLGALYVLSALTLVSEDARDTMPWLYASVFHN